MYGTFCLLTIYTATLIYMHVRKNNKLVNEKNCVTVILARAGDGSKLKSLIIFKHKTMAKIQNKHGVVAVQENGWMDSEIMKIEKLRRCRIGGLSRPRSLLVLDSFEAHKAEQVKRSLKSENTDFESLPAGQH